MHPFIHLCIGLWLETALQCRSSMSSNCLVFHTSGGIWSITAALLFLIFLRTESSSSWVHGPNFMSNCLLIILLIGSCVTFGGFPCRFSKYCFHSFILSWFTIFNLALALLFLLITSFNVCQAIQDCLSSTESLILSSWFCMYPVCSFRYILANSFCAFSSFRTFMFLGFFLTHLEVVFTSARFSLTANVSHRTFYLVVAFVGYNSLLPRGVRRRHSPIRHFGYLFSVFSCSASNLFLNSNTYLSPIYMLLRRAQS